MVASYSDYGLIILNSALEPYLRHRQLYARSALLRRIINLVCPAEVIAPNASAAMHDPSINCIQRIFGLVGIQ